jgi:hypothetical protein
MDDSTPPVAPTPPPPFAPRSEFPEIGLAQMFTAVVGKTVELPQLPQFGPLVSYTIEGGGPKFGTLSSDGAGHLFYTATAVGVENLTIHFNNGTDQFRTVDFVTGTNVPSWQSPGSTLTETKGDPLVAFYEEMLHSDPPPPAQTPDLDVSPSTQNSITVISGPQHGTVTTFATLGLITYTPDAGYTGGDVMTFQVHLLSPDSMTGDVRFYDGTFTFIYQPKSVQTTNDAPAGDDASTPTAAGPALDVLAAKDAQPALPATANSATPTAGTNTSAAGNAQANAPPAPTSSPLAPPPLAAIDAALGAVTGNSGDSLADDTTSTTGDWLSLT